MKRKCSISPYSKLGQDVGASSNTNSHNALESENRDCDVQQIQK